MFSENNLQNFLAKVTVDDNHKIEYLSKLEK